MRQPSSTETVVRPEPGIARGRWEAPAWAFWVGLAVVLVALVGLVVVKQRRARAVASGSSGKKS